MEEPRLVEAVDGDFPPVDLVKQFERVGRQALEIQLHQFLGDIRLQFASGFAQDQRLDLEPAALDVIQYLGERTQPVVLVVNKRAG